MSDYKSLLNTTENTVTSPLDVSVIYTDIINPLSGTTLTINNAVLNPPPTPGPALTVFNTVNSTETNFLGGRLSTDTIDRIDISNLGNFYFGSGSAAYDTVLYRSAANSLSLGTTTSNASSSLSLYNMTFGGTLFGKLLDARAQTAGTAFMCSQTGDAYWRVLVNNNGCIRLGNGTTQTSGQFAGLVCIDTTGDLYLSKDDTTTPDARGLLRVQTIGTKPTSGDNLILKPDGASIDISGKSIINGTVNYTTSGASGNFISSNLSADTASRFNLTNDGILSFGPGNAAADLFLYRSSFSTFAVGSTSGNSSGVLTAGTLSGNTTYAQNLKGGYVSGVTAFDQGLSICAGIQPSAAGNVTIATSGTINSTGTYNLITSSTGSSIASTAGSYNTIMGSNTSAIISTGSNSVIINSNNATINSSSSYNTIMGVGSGNTSITGTGGGNFLWGGNISTSYSNVFGLSDSSSTTVSVNAPSLFQCRFYSGFYFASNSANSIGVNCGPSANSWSAISDLRLKNVYGEVENNKVLDAIDSIRVVKYNYKDDLENHGVRFGMIAQEVNDVYEKLSLRKRNQVITHKYNQENPDEALIEAVSGDEIAYLAISCIKEMKQKIKALEIEIVKMKGEDFQIL